MGIQRACFAAGLAATLAGLAGAALPAAPEDLVEDAIHFHKDKNHAGRDHLVHPVTVEHSTWLNDMPRKMNGEPSSIAWNLPPGVIVVVYESPSGNGRQLPLWGRGGHDSLVELDFENKARTWAWFYVDGADDPATRVRDGFSPRPIGSRESKETAPRESMQLFKKSDLKGKKKDIVELDALTGRPEGEFRPLDEGVQDQMSSLRWNLPAGVIVIFADNADGTGRRFAIWGNGEIPTLGNFKFNDKASAWAWFNIATTSE